MLMSEPDVFLVSAGAFCCDVVLDPRLDSWTPTEVRADSSSTLHWAHVNVCLCLFRVCVAGESALFYPRGSSAHPEGSYMGTFRCLTVCGAGDLLSQQVQDFIHYLIIILTESVKMFNKYVPCECLCFCRYKQEQVEESAAQSQNGTVSLYRYCVTPATHHWSTHTLMFICSRCVSGVEIMWCWATVLWWPGRVCARSMRSQPYIR